MRVELADVGHQNGPVDAAQVAGDVGVDAAPLRPQLQAAQRGAEVRHAGHLPAGGGWQDWVQVRGARPGGEGGVGDLPPVKAASQRRHRGATNGQKQP